MSEIARWSYANTATVRPFVSMDSWTQQAVYGEPYTIACNWIAEASQARDDTGAEFIGRHTIYTEDARPKFRDMIQLEGMDGWEEIRAKTSWDMNLFEDTMDFRLVTG